MSVTVEQQLLQQQHHEDIVLAHRYRLSLHSAPRQSSFRVLAVFFYELDDGDYGDCGDDNSTSASTGPSASASATKRHHVVGANDEPCYINGSICAERAALVQLRFIPNLIRITKVVISTDAAEPVHPGMLCREFMASHPKIDPKEMEIILAGSVCRRCGVDISTSEASIEEFSNLLQTKDSVCYCPSSSSRTGEELADGHGLGLSKKYKYHQWDIVQTKLCDIYPFPSVYTRLTAGQSVQLGTKHGLLSTNNINDKNKRNFNKLKLKDLSTNNRELIQAAIDAAREYETNDDNHNNRSNLHPIQYAAAIQMSDNTIHTAMQHKALEYGCSVDAVTQFATMITRQEKRRDSEEGAEGERSDGSGGIYPVMLVQADNFGVLHPPFATARAFLAEYGHGKCNVLIMVEGDDDNKKDDDDDEVERDVSPSPSSPSNDGETQMVVMEVSVEDLAPFLPNMGELWKNDET